MNKKGLAVIFSYILYLLIALTVLSIVLVGSLEITTKNQENYKYNEMIKTITYINDSINDVASQRFSNKQITVNNPDEILIDCQEDIIYGNIIYSGEFRIDQNSLVNGITIYKKINNLYFEKTISESGLINIDCNSINLNKGENIININYIDYSNQKINITITRPIINNTLQ